MQPIIGCQLDVDFGEREERANAAIAQRQGPALSAARPDRGHRAGYRNLVRLVSRAYLDNCSLARPSIVPAPIARRLCRRHHLPDRRPARADRPRAARRAPAARRRAACWSCKTLFGDRALCRTRTAGRLRPRRSKPQPSILPIAHDLPLVATNEAFFPTRDDFEAHDALIAIAEGSVIAVDDRRRLTPDNYLKSPGRNGRRCSPTSPRRSTTPSRSRGAVPSIPKSRKPDPAALSPRATSPMPTRPSRPRPPSLRRQARDGLDRAPGVAAARPQGFTEAALSRAAGFRARHHRDA